MDAAYIQVRSIDRSLRYCKADCFIPTTGIGTVDLFHFMLLSAALNWVEPQSFWKVNVLAVFLKKIC